jgi:hypothetical protein
VCQEQIAACNDDTIQKLRELHPAQPLALNLEHLPLPAELEEFWESEDGRAILNKWFSVTTIRKYFCTPPALGAADIDGQRGREIVAYLFMNNDHELHQFLIDELTLPYVLGTLHPNFLPEYAGGVLLAFLKPKPVPRNPSLRWWCWVSAPQALPLRSRRRAQGGVSRNSRMISLLETKFSLSFSHVCPPALLGGGGA